MKKNVVIYDCVSNTTKLLGAELDVPHEDEHRMCTSSRLQTLYVGANGRDSRPITLSKKTLRLVPSLRVVNLSEGIQVDGAVLLTDTLRKYANVERLDLSSNNVGVLGTEALRKEFPYLSKLRYLDLSSNRLDPLALAQALSHAPKLQGLDLSRNDLGHGGGMVFLETSLVFMQTLRHLNLSSNGICAEGAMQILRSAHRMETLDLSCNDVGPVGAAALASALDGMPGLRSLDLSHNGIGAEGAEVLSATLRDMRHLESLRLAGNAVGDSGAAALASAFECMSSLRSVVLSANAIGDDGGVRIARALIRSTDLRLLDLGGNRLGCAAAEATATALEWLEEIQHLDLSNNLIGVRGAHALSRGLECTPDLRYLFLSFNDLRSEGVAAIFRAIGPSRNTLRQVDLSFNNSQDDEDAARMISSVDYNLCCYTMECDE